VDAVEVHGSSFDEGGGSALLLEQVYLSNCCASNYLPELFGLTLGDVHNPTRSRRDREGEDPRQSPLQASPRSVTRRCSM